MCGTSSLASDVPGTSRIGWTGRCRLRIIPFGSLVLMLLSMLRFATCPVRSGGVARWLDLAIAGRVVMVLGEPPCETWSVARWNGGSRATGSGPRAVRSSLHFWGLHDLDAGERQQVALGNAIMRTVILCLAAARVYGFAAVMEHPQLPSWMPQAPSSWKLPGLKLLAKAGGTECVHLDQCCCGAPWKKPTRLFAVGIPELGRLVA